MEEVVALLIQFVLEIGIQLLGSIGVDVLTTSRRHGEKEDTGCGWLILFAVVGAICAGFSLLFAPNLILPNLSLRVGNMIVAPLLVGVLSYSVARYVWTRKKLEPRHHFWRGFWFALAFGVVRFAYAHR